MKIIDVPYANIDLEALESLKAQVEKLFELNEYSILLNLTNVNYLSSTGLGLLVYINNKCSENGGNFGIFGLQEYTLDMLKLTKLDSVIKVFKDKEEAQNAFS
ncbi:MAG: STAS domain-containing protein [Vampirovibrionia bacterium]